MTHTPGTKVFINSSHGDFLGEIFHILPANHDIGFDQRYREIFGLVSGRGHTRIVSYNRYIVQKENGRYYIINEHTIMGVKRG